MESIEELERSARRQRVWAWGCAIGCVAVLVLAGGLVLGGWLYLSGSRPLPPTAAFVSPATGAVAQVDVRPGDLLLEEVAVELMTLNAVRKAPPTRSGKPLDIDRQEALSLVRAVGPMRLVFTATLEKDNEEFTKAGALSISKFWRLCSIVGRGILRDPKNPTFRVVPTQGNATVALTPQGTTLAVLDNTYMATEQRFICDEWLAALTASAEPTESERFAPALLAAWERLDPQAPVRLALTNAHGEVALLVKQIEEDKLRNFLSAAGFGTEAVRSIAAQLRPINNRDGALQVDVLCADEQAAQKAHFALQMLGAYVTLKFGAVQEVNTELPEPTVARLTARVQDVPGLLVEALQSD